MVTEEILHYKTIRKTSRNVNVGKHKIDCAQIIVLFLRLSQALRSNRVFLQHVLQGTVSRNCFQRRTNRPKVVTFYESPEIFSSVYKYNPPQHIIRPPYCLQYTCKFPTVLNLAYTVDSPLIHDQLHHLQQRTVNKTRCVIEGNGFIL